VIDNVVVQSPFKDARRVLISLPSEFDAKFKQKLKVLVTLWADARKQKKIDKLQPFNDSVEGMRNAVANFALYPLQMILSEINQSCSLIATEQKTFSQVSPDVDKLMNQLISSAQTSPNPLLIETSKASPNSISKANKIAGKLERRMNVGVVDDEKSSGMAIAALIAEFDFNVEYFESIEALKASEAIDSLDLVLLDILMPGVTKNQVFDFASSLNSLGIKVISYSGLFSFDVRLAAVRAGVADFIVKPTSILNIVEKINRVLNLQKDRKYHIVFIDDQQMMGEFYQTVLEEAGCEVYFMNSVKEMFANLHDIHPDLFLLDMNMPDVNGLEAAKMIRQEKKFDFTPILFLTADDQLEVKLEALKGGAEDVISKRTPPALVTELVLTRLKRALAIREFVSKDSLTGVLNHGQIMDAAMNAFRLSLRQRSEVSIAMLDLDHFKKVNDTFGHAAGDKVLSGLGQLLSRSLRNTDFIGRYGGEEFMLVLVGTNSEGALKKLNAIKDIFATEKFHFKGRDFSCTFSVGVADLAKNVNLPHAIHQADQALYISKESGRNRVTLFTDDK
jgi:diguanylate cyclase (GGDEF)-like protein